jgi:hypothetical protein
VRESKYRKTAKGYSVEVTKDNDKYIYTSRFLNHILGKFISLDDRGDMEASRDAANIVCEKHLSLLPLRRAVHIAAGGIRLAQIDYSVNNDTITTLDSDQLQAIIDNPDTLIALHNSRVLPNTHPNGATTARGLASDSDLSLPNKVNSGGRHG